MSWGSGIHVSVPSGVEQRQEADLFSALLSLAKVDRHGLAPLPSEAGGLSAEGLPGVFSGAPGKGWGGGNVTGHGPKIP